MPIGKKYLINKIFGRTNIPYDQLWLFLLSSISALTFIILAILWDQYFILAIPFGLIAVAWVINDVKGFLFTLFALLPLSMEVDLPGGFSTDLPDEPMMLAMMGLLILYVIKFHKSISSSILLHPITLIILIHYFWIWATTITSIDFILSFKYAVSKTWYIIVFYFGPLLLFNSSKDYKRIYKYVLITLVFATGYLLFRHASYNFSFETVNKVVWPFFRNHVSSSSIMALSIPFLWALYRMDGVSKIQKLFMLLSAIILLAGIFFSFTRAAILSIFIGIGIYYVVRMRLMKYALGLTIIISSLLILNWGKDNKYLNFAPDFEHTITHTEFSDLLSATYKLKDISTMERVFRWVAGYHMIKERPLMGFGPANFYNNYKSYTLYSFRTYVSDNPEKSGVHSYYMMVAIEQGIIGFIIFIILCLFTLIYGESIYHKLRKKEDRLLAMSALISFGIILSLLIMNDMIETDKVGPFFFLSMAILTYLSKTKDTKISQQ